MAIHWAALDADAINLNLFDLEQSETLAQAVQIANNTGGPQLNMLLADDKGHIAWTLMVKFLKGSVMTVWLAAPGAMRAQVGTVMSKLISCHGSSIHQKAF